MCYLEMKIASKFVSDCLRKILESFQKYAEKHTDINKDIITLLRT